MWQTFTEQRKLCLSWHNGSDNAWSALCGNDPENSLNKFGRGYNISSKSNRIVSGWTTTTICSTITQQRKIEIVSRILVYNIQLSHKKIAQFKM